MESLVEDLSHESYKWPTGESIYSVINWLFTYEVRVQV